MLDYCLWDVVDCICLEEEKIAGNTRDRGEKHGRARRHCPRSPSRRCSAIGFCARGSMSWYEYNIYIRVLFINEDKAVNKFFCCGCDGWLYCLCAA